MKNRGTTVFEILLYIGLFTILSTSTIYLYISIIKTTEQFGLLLQKKEIQIYARQLVEYQLDTKRVLDQTALQNGMQRILKWYPDFELIDLSIEYEVDIDSKFNNATNMQQIIDTRLVKNGSMEISSENNSFLKIVYQLKQKKNKKTYTDTIYFSVF